MKKLFKEWFDIVVGMLGAILVAVLFFLNTLPMLLTRETQEPLWLAAWFVTLPPSIMLAKRIGSATFFKDLK